MLYRAFLSVWIAIWIVVAAAGMKSATESKASDDSITPLVASGIGAASLGGVEARIVSVEHRLTETIVRLQLTGREDAGSFVHLLARSALVSDDGRAYREMQGEADGRSLTLHYPPMSQDALVHSRLELDGVAVTHGSESIAADKKLLQIGRFVLGLESDRVVAIPGVESSIIVEAGLGSGSMVITTVVLEPGATVFRGRLRGFTPEQIQEILLKPRLETVDGLIEFYTSRSGDGDDLTQFELRFGDAGNAEAAVLSIRLDLADSPGPYGASARGSLVDSVGAVAALQLDLPPR